MAHPAVVKASKIANRAVAQGWKGHLDSDVESDHRKTVLTLSRNDECLVITWRNTSFEQGAYSIFDSLKFIDNLVEIKQIVMGWPDVINLLEQCRTINPIHITDNYIRLPFNWREDDDETIINSLVGKQIWWWNSEAGKIHHEIVPFKKHASRIVPVGHRKMYHFKTIDVGLCSILLDMVLKVENV